MSGNKSTLFRPNAGVRGGGAAPTIDDALDKVSVQFRDFAGQNQKPKLRPAEQYNPERNPYFGTQDARDEGKRLQRPDSPAASNAKAVYDIGEEALKAAKEQGRRLVRSGSNPDLSKYDSDTENDAKSGQSFEARLHKKMLRSLEETSAGMRQKLQDSHQKNEQLMSELNKVDLKIQQAEHHYQTQMDLWQKNDEARAEAGRAKSKIKTIQQESKIKEHLAIESGLRVRVDTLEKKNKSDAEFANNKERILRSALDNKSKAVENLEAEINALKFKMDEIQDKYDNHALEQENADLLEKLKRATAANAQLDQEHRGLQREKLAPYEQLKVNYETIQAANEKKLQRKDEILLKANQKIKDLNGKVEELGNKLLEVGTPETENALGLTPKAAQKLNERQMAAAKSAGYLKMAANLVNDEDIKKLEAEVARLKNDKIQMAEKLNEAKEIIPGMAKQALETRAELDQLKALVESLPNPVRSIIEKRRAEQKR